MKQFFFDARQRSAAFFQGFISGMWFVWIMRQVSKTAGNVAESAFLLATLWVITNAVAHELLTWFMPERTIELFNYLAVIAFSALPELIVIPVIITCFIHWCVAVKNKNKISATWAILYTLPTLFFIFLTVLAITRFVSTGGTHFVASSGPELVTRCLSGWFYAVINMLFAELGKPHYASQLGRKDAEIDRLNREITSMNTRYSIEISELSNRIKERDAQVNRLAERASSLELRGIENYPIIQNEWIEKGKRTATIDEIAEVTGLTKQRINGAIKSGKLQKDNRNKELIRLSSLIEWLKAEAPIPQNGHCESHTDPLQLTAINWN